MNSAQPSLVYGFLHKFNKFVHEACENLQPILDSLITDTMFSDRDDVLSPRQPANGHGRRQNQSQHSNPERSIKWIPCACTYSLKN